MQAFVTSPTSFRTKLLLNSPPRRTRTHPVCTAATRRDVLKLLSAVPLLSHLPDASPANAQALISPTSSGTVFSVIPTTIADVNLLPESVDDVLDDLTPCEAVFLGEHHNSLVDHTLQARIIERLAARKPLAVGLEMFQQQFQPALDKFIAREISELDLFLETDWENSWVWPYEVYLPVLRTCRQYKVPLVALSMDQGTLNRLRESGITALSPSEMRKHVGSPAVFSAISAEDGYKKYVNECITPSYASHYKMGVLEKAANFNSFYTARVLRDEAMATQVARFLRAHPGHTMVCLMGSDHVKFEYGVSGRLSRQLTALYERNANVAAVQAAAQSGSDIVTIPAAPVPKVRTIMLNPGPADAFDYRDGSLKLEMAAGQRPVPIADYLWFSSPAAANPRRRVKTRLLPPVEHLVNG